MARRDPSDYGAGVETNHVDKAGAKAVTPAVVNGLRPWFCVRSHPKHEHIAAAYLASELELEVYLPRIRFKRATRRGPVWFTEALFPGYLFARLDLGVNLRQLQHGRGVSGVVHFGDEWPMVPEEAIAELRARIPDDEVRVVDDDPEIGEMVEIAGGAFRGLNAIVARSVSGAKAVAVLLEFLGRQTMVHVPQHLLVRETNLRQGLA